MTLLNPIWLFALAAIGIPVVIHLWNIRPGRTLKVGSIALFKESSPKSSRSFKLTDLLLLALRCLLLALIAFLLAGPTWQQHTAPNSAKGWILIPEGNLSETYHQFRPSIDFLIKAGYEPHYLKRGFQKIDLKKDLKPYPDRSVLNDHLNYWSILKHLGSAFKSDKPVHIFSPNTADHFAGDRPSTSLNIQWHSYTPIYTNEHGAALPDTAAWIAGAWLARVGDIRLIRGIATSKGTNFEYDHIAIGDDSGKYHSVVDGSGDLYISLKSDPEEEVKVDTATKQIAIYADQPEDANYLRSALQAVAQLTQQKTDIKQYGHPADIRPDQDWLFWLSEKPLPRSIRGNHNVLTYERGKVSRTDSWLVNNGSGIGHQNETQIALHQTIAGKTKGETIWDDGYSKPVLSYEAGKTNNYHFYSRFNPQWSGLVWSDAFPKWILALTNNLELNAARHERRALSDDQIRPVYHKGTAKGNAPGTQNTPLDRYFWIAVLIIFMAERWLATRNKQLLVND